MSREDHITIFFLYTCIYFSRRLVLVWQSYKVAPYFLLSAVIYLLFCLFGSVYVFLWIWYLNNAKAGIRGHWRCCTYHYCQWTVSIKPIGGFHSSIITYNAAGRSFHQNLLVIFQFTILKECVYFFLNILEILASFGHFQC